MEITNNIIKFINPKLEFTKCLTHVSSPIQYTFKECLTILSEPNLKPDINQLFKINVVLDYLHDELNTGHWSNVSINTRQAFSASSFIKAIILLRSKENEDLILKTLKCIDLGLLLGAPLPENEELLTKTASYLTEILNKNYKPISETPNKKRKYSTATLYNNILAEEISTVSCPSVESFNKNFFELQIPVKLIDCMNHWPAMEKWLDVNYLLTKAGNRTVPVEIGSNYADENWGQKLMTLQEFIKNYYLKSSEDLGYLAQHNLFDQVKELRNDICIPDYCCLSKNDDISCDPDINAWFGPQNTVSPLHHDPKNNILSQVFGTKQVILFSPNDSEYLYPHSDKMLNNTAQLNPLEVNLEKFPLFQKAKMYKCLLKPGEMLFIPVKWWHHVTALDKSFSVSFWWE